MFCRPRTAPPACVALVVIACLSSAACSRSHSRFERIAVLPFENLTVDPALDWASAGIPEGLKLRMTGLPGVAPAGAASARDIVAAGANRSIEGYLSRDGEQLRIEAVLRDTGTQRVAKTASAKGPQNKGLLPLISSIAAQLHGGSGTSEPANGEALRAYAEAVNSPDPAAAAAACERAVAADPNFGAAYVAWARFLIARGDRDGARKVIAAAGTRGEALAEIARARLSFLSASLEGRRDAQEAALLVLTRLTPADPEPFRGLGDVRFEAHSCRQAAEWYKQALAREPENAALLNQLGYTLAYARDLPGAADALHRYRELNPAEANPLDSLGDVHFYLGRFSEAEKFYREAYEKDPGFLGGGEPQKIAWARLMRGDLKGADESFEKFLEVRRQPGNPAADLRRAQWEYVTGRGKQAVSRLLSFAKGNGSAASLALSQLSIWSLEARDLQAARDYAGRAVATAQAPGPRLLAEVCRYAAGGVRELPDSMPPVLKRYSMAYALLAGRNFQAAVPVLRELYYRLPPGAPEPVNVLLAWALIECQSGGPADAPKLDELLGVYQVPRPEADRPFECFSFPRLFQLQSIAAERDGRRDEAAASLKLFRMFGEPNR